MSLFSGGTTFRERGFRVHPVKFLQPSLQILQGGPCVHYDTPDPTHWDGLHQLRDSVTVSIVQSKTYQPRRQKLVRRVRPLGILIPVLLGTCMNIMNTQTRHWSFYVDMADPRDHVHTFENIPHLFPSRPCSPCPRYSEPTSQFWSGETNPEETSPNPPLCSRLKG